MIRGFGSGKSRSKSVNRSHVRRLRWLRRQSHLYQDRLACSMTSNKHNNKQWKHNPEQIVEPGTEAEVMGPYCPRGEYTDKATFEARRSKP